jgi:4-hydroxybenzoate polyprenyltransferase
MHQFLEKIVLIAKIFGNKILTISYRLSAIVITQSKKSYLILKQLCSATTRVTKSKWPFIRNRLIQYCYLTRLDKPVGIILLLWPVLWALWIAAKGAPDLDVLIIFILGVIIMRSAGCVLNDLADRNLDRHVSRTRDRPITSGKVKPLEAIGLITTLLACAVILVLNLNILTFKLSFVGVFLAIIYPFMKRVTYLPQVFLGLAFAWAIPMAFAAQTNSIPDIAWLLFITTVLWAVVYDTMYAMVDKVDDIKVGVKSTAILFDDADRIIIGSIQIMILFSQILTGTKLELGKYYFTGIALASLLSVYQQYLIKDRIPENCFRAFLNNQWYGMIIFAGIYLNYMFG